MFGENDQTESHLKQDLVDLGDSGTEDDEVDPLDSFMNTMADEAKKPIHSMHSEDIVFDNGDIDSDSGYYPARSTPAAFVVSHPKTPSDDENGPRAKRKLEGLSPFDHSSVTYSPFIKDFYKEHGAITTMSNPEVAELRKTMGISVSGSQVPKCVCSFVHLNLPEGIMSVLRFHGFSAPTPIQSQAIPCILAGRDVIGIAMTGSGKTLSYVIPTVIHLLGNASAKLPRAAIICPTRELAIQIEEELYRFAKRTNDRFKSIALTGGLSKYEQFQMLIKGCDVVVGNPGRMIDLLQMKKGLDLSGITLCVLDEADRMFSMGFESQLRTLVQRIRPDRQMLMFSATMPPRIERLAREIMVDPVRVVVGSIGQAATVIDQNVFLVHSEEEKYVWIAATLPGLISQGGRILIFVNTKSAGDALLHRVRQTLGNNGKVVVGSIHGDLDQSERMRIMNEFKAGRCPVLIATDVAARGIDVAGVTCVIEFDAAKNLDTHTHRIGRTGRAGSSGTSWTLLMPNEHRIAAHITESIEALGIKSPPAELVAFAMKHTPFREAHIAHAKEPPNENSHSDDSWEPLEKHFKKGRSESLD